MPNRNLIPLHQVCQHYNVEFSFVESLNEFGLMQIITIEETHYINDDQILPLEKMIRLHFDLEINIEGIEVIANLLTRVDALQEELRITRSRLRFYESD
jgi:hypothetical protein